MFCFLQIKIHGKPSPSIEIAQVDLTFIDFEVENNENRC